MAETAKVSAATVSNVLSGRRKVTPDLARRVQDAVDHLGYRPDVAAASLRGAVRHVVGCVVPELANPFFAGLIGALESRTRAAGLRLLVAGSGGDPGQERRQLEGLLAWRPLGVVVVPADGAFAARDVLAAEAVPCVILDRVPDDADGLDAIGVDDREAAQQATAGLIARGHHAILALGSSAALGNMRARLAGVRAAAEAVDAAVRVEALEVGFTTERAAETIRRRLAAGPRPSAIFALNNVVTLATLKAAAACDLAVPDDLSLVGFDDYDWMEFVQPPITAVRQPVEALARAAADRLIARAADPLLAPVHQQLACTLVWRRSVATLRGAASAPPPAEGTTAGNGPLTGRAGEAATPARTAG